jgi:adenylate cyclase
MGQEIERKFLVLSDAWRAGAQGTVYRQGYLSADKERTVRVRRLGDEARLTVKGVSRGATRAEFEYPLPVGDADAMLDNLCLQPIIEKIRYKIPFASFVWEVDEFRGKNAGLIVAEIELPAEDTSFERPDWVGKEVTSDIRYFNSNLVERPFSDWPERGAREGGSAPRLPGDGDGQPGPRGNSGDAGVPRGKLE